MCGYQRKKDAWIHHKECICIHQNDFLKGTQQHHKGFPAPMKKSGLCYHVVAPLAFSGLTLSKRFTTLTEGKEYRTAMLSADKSIHGCSRWRTCIANVKYFNGQRRVDLIPQRNDSQLGYTAVKWLTRAYWKCASPVVKTMPLWQQKHYGTCQNTSGTRHL